MRGAFGEDVAAANVNLQNAGLSMFAVTQKIQEQRERTKALQLKNAIYNEWEHPKLYSQDGYYNMLGQNASGRSKEVLDDYASFVEQKKKDLGIRGTRANEIADYVISSTAQRISSGIMAHDLKQTQEAEKNEATLLIQNATQQGINDRNSDEGVAAGLANLQTAVSMYGKISNMDDTQIALMQNNATSGYFSALIEKCASENNLKGKVYLEKYGKFILPEEKLKLDKVMRNSEINISARNFADDCYNSGLNIQQAFEKANAIKDLDERDAAVSRVESLYSTREANKNKVYNDKYDAAFEKIVQTMSYDDIPNDLPAEYRVRLKNFIKQGGGQDDVQTYLNLAEMSLTNADKFSKLNLNLYADKLTTTQLVNFREQQMKIQRHGYSDVDEESEYIKDAAKKLGWGFINKKEFPQTVQNLINTEELRYGRKYTENELEEKTKVYSELLGQKGANGQPSAYDVLKQNATKEFYEKVFNGKKYFEKANNRSMTPVEFRSMVNSCANQTKQKFVQDVYQQTKQEVTAKRGESKTLIDFRKNSIPDIENVLGHKLNITSTVREPNGKYTSWHEKVLAMDIGYSLRDGRKMSTQQKITLIGQVLASPQVHKIGISSADKDGQLILDAYGAKYKDKIQDMNKIGKDGKTTDQRLGTNHTNHLHITFKEKV